MCKTNNNRRMNLSVPSILTNPYIHDHYTNVLSSFIQRLLFLEGISLKNTVLLLSTLSNPALIPKKCKQALTICNF